MVGEIRRGLAAIAATIPLVAALSPEDAAICADVYGRHSPESLLAEWLAWSGRFADALPWGMRAVPTRPAGAPPLGEPSLSYAAAYLGLAVAHAGLGDPAAARRAFAEARACNVTLDHAHQLGMNARQELGWVVLPYQAERLADRRALADEAAQAWRRAGGARPDIIPTSGTLPLLLLEGRWAEARSVAAQLHAVRNSWWSRLVANAALATLARERGDLATAWAHATEDLADGPDTAPGDVWLLDALPVMRLAALIAAAGGDLPAARAWLACHDRWLAWSNSVLGRAEGQRSWAEYHRAAGDPVQARASAEAALAHASAPRQPLALLAAHRLLGELDTEAGQHAEAAEHLAAALALADACAAPYERALTLLAQAELHIAAGHRDEAGAALAEACARLIPLEAHLALARADALAARLAADPLPSSPALPFGLTAREAAVLRLAAQGLPSAGIAARLFVTPRTVGAHLTAIYTKLGVENRAAAIRVALDHDLH
jgi:DNA-binding NarL/FixJ family response regulator